MAPAGFGEVAERLRRSTVSVRIGDGCGGCGSGVIWNPDGLIVTNAHVARGPRATIELWDGRSVLGSVIAADMRRDLAAIEVEARGLPAATPGDSSALRPGELVIAVGNPLGFTGALTTGVVHALGPVPGLGRHSWVQADVRLAPGNSGGPLADAQGRVIGINAMIARGLGLAVPSIAVADFLKRGPSGVSLGVVVRPVRIPEGVGLLLLEVAPGSAAAAASLMLGDLLTGVDGRPFRAPEDLRDALEQGAATVRIEFLRGDRSRRREAVVRLRARTAEAA